jgi:hypothetical protein
VHTIYVHRTPWTLNSLSHISAPPLTLKSIPLLALTYFSPSLLFCCLTSQSVNCNSHAWNVITHITSCLTYHISHHLTYVMSTRVSTHFSSELTHPLLSCINSHTTSPLHDFIFPHINEPLTLRLFSFHFPPLSCPHYTSTNILSPCWTSAHLI